MLDPSVEYIKLGSHGDYVRVVQKVLNEYLSKGWTPLDPDGIFGPHTERVVKDFQSRHRLNPDGIVGPLTRAKLFPLGTFHSACLMTSPPSQAVQADGRRTSFQLINQISSPPPATQPRVIQWPSSTSFPLSAMRLGSPVLTDDLPGMPDPLPFPDLLPQLPSLTLPSLPSFPSLTLPSFFPKKIQLSAGEQRSLPKLTLFGPPPKSNPVVDTFVFTVRGVWPIGRGGQFQAGGSLGLPLSQPISDRKNTTYQVFAQGLTPDLLISYKSWAHLFLIGKASVTVAKDGSSTSAAISPQFKASFDITKDGKVSFSVVGGPQISGATGKNGLTLSLAPFVTNAGITVTLF